MIKDLDRYLKTQSTGPWAANRVAALERSLGELYRILEGKVHSVLSCCAVRGKNSKSSKDVSRENEDRLSTSDTEHQKAARLQERPERLGVHP